MHVKEHARVHIDILFVRRCCVEESCGKRNKAINRLNG